MSYVEEISRMSESGCSDIELLEYIDKHFDEIECEFNGEEYKKPKKHDYYFCMDCKLRKIVDYKRSVFGRNLIIESIQKAFCQLNNEVTSTDLRIFVDSIKYFIPKYIVFYWLYSSCILVIVIF